MCVISVRIDIEGVKHYVEEEQDIPNEELVEAIMSAKWVYSQTYSVGSAGSVEERQPVW